MIDLRQTQIRLDFAAEYASDIYLCLKTLYSTPAGTAALDRDFGIDWRIVDMPLNIAQGKCVVELIEKTRRYEPRAAVKDVLFIHDENSELKGVLIPKVVLSIVKQ